MTVAELIKKLQAFPSDMEVTITDGFRCHHYRGDFGVILFDDEEDEDPTVDIGVGGMTYTNPEL